MPSLKPLPSNATFAAARADEAAEQAAAKVARLRMRKPRKYPGRNMVMARDQAAELRKRQLFADGEGGSDPYKCSDPFVVNAIGLSSGAMHLHDYRWTDKATGKVPVRFATRCRKCAECLMHRRRLWSARASDELKAAHRTWFATLTIRPEDRFVASMYAARMAGDAGHGMWNSMSAENQFRYLVKHLNKEIDRYLNRVRKGGAPFRYLLVSEAHKDGFPHFHLLIHEAALPLTKRLLESNWRLGFSQFRLVNNTDPRSAFYVCKYLAKSALTRVRASKRYGRAELIRAATEAIETLTRRTPVSPPPVSGAPGEVIA